MAIYNPYRTRPDDETVTQPNFGGVRSVSFTDPTTISRDRALADSLRQQSMTPLNMGTAGGYVIPPSPMQGIAKLGEAAAAVFAEKKAREKEEANKQLNTNLTSEMLRTAGRPVVERRPETVDGQPVTQSQLMSNIQPTEIADAYSPEALTRASAIGLGDPNASDATKQLALQLQLKAMEQTHGLAKTRAAAQEKEELRLQGIKDEKAMFEWKQKNTPITKTEREKHAEAAGLEGEKRSNYLLTGELPKDDINVGGWTREEILKEFDMEKYTKASVQNALSNPSKFGEEGYTLKLKPDIAKVQTRADKTMADIKEGMASIARSMEQINVGGGMADIAAIVGFTKALDPGSVAREGEVRLVATSEGFVEDIKSTIQKAKSKGVLTPLMRQNMFDALLGMQRTYRQAYEGAKAFYQRTYADEFGYDLDDLVGPPPFGLYKEYVYEPKQQAGTPTGGARETSTNQAGQKKTIDGVEYIYDGENWYKLG